MGAPNGGAMTVDVMPARTRRRFRRRYQNAATTPATPATTRRLKITAGAALPCSSGDGTGLAVLAFDPPCIGERGGVRADGGRDDGGRGVSGVADG